MATPELRIELSALRDRDTTTNPAERAWAEVGRTMVGLLGNSVVLFPSALRLRARDGLGGRR